MRNRPRRARAVIQPELALRPVTAHPLTRAADTDSGGRGRLRQRPLALYDPTAQLTTPFQTERRVSVKLPPVSSLAGLSWLGSSHSLQGGTAGQTYVGTTPRSRGTHSRSVDGEARAVPDRA